VSLFRNGHMFRLAIRSLPPPGHTPPVVQVFMAGAAGRFVAVPGKVDTGAFRTMLTFEVGRELGIDDPSSNALATGSAQTATDQPFAFYVHRVLVHIADGPGQSIVFPLDAAFAGQLKRNLFGTDWLRHLCLAVDRQGVHFLKD